MDIAFLIIGCVQSKKGRGRGFWIAALCIDIVVGLGTLFSNLSEAGTGGLGAFLSFLFFAGIMCAIYIPTGLMISRRYRAFAAAQQAAQQNPYSAPYGAPMQPQQNYYQPAQPQNNYYQPAQPRNSYYQPAQSAQPQNNYYQPAQSAQPQNAPYPTMPPQARPYDYSDQK